MRDKCDAWGVRLKWRDGRGGGWEWDESLYKTEQAARTAETWWSACHDIDEAAMVKLIPETVNA